MDDYPTLGCAKREKGELEGAASAIAKAIRIDPLRSAPRPYRARVHEPLRNHKAAVEDFVRAWELAPSNWPDRDRTHHYINWLRRQPRQFLKISAKKRKIGFGLMAYAGRDSDMTAQFKVVAGTGSGTEFQIAAGSAVIFGRISPANVRVHDPWCSRSHCRIRHVDGLIRVTDLGSRHGTFVNGRRIDSETILQSGDRLRIGRCEMLFTRIAEKVAPAVVPPAEAPAVEEPMPLVIPILENTEDDLAPVAAEALSEGLTEAPTADDLPVTAELETFCCPACGEAVTGDAPACPHCETEFTENAAP